MHEEDLYYLKRNRENEGITALDSAGNYTGEYFNGYLTVILTKAPSLKEEFNWHYFLEYLTKNKINFEIVNYGHWFAGSYQRIGIYPHQPKLSKELRNQFSNTPKKLENLDAFLEDLEYLGVLDEDAYNEFLWKKYYEYMDNEGYETLQINIENELKRYLEIEIIKELWEYFCDECSWEYNDDEYYITINEDDFTEFVNEISDIELYRAAKNPAQLKIPLSV
jgi:hypothetical protein